MIKKFLLILIFSSSLHADSLQPDNICKPILVVAIMVKNEESVINATLEPFVKENFFNDIAFFIFDTGSTDKTIETVQKYLTSNKQNFYIEQEPFVDFSTSRNKALQLTKEKFPDSSFILMIDAEWYTHNIAGLISYCKNSINEHCSAYAIKLTSDSSDLYHVRLLRAKSNVFFKGLVHEVPIASEVKNLPANIYFDYRPSNKGKEKTIARWQNRDVPLLLKSISENPHDPRTYFYLAQTYECLGELENAYKYYEIRSKLPGWDEENYETFYRLGRVANELSKRDSGFTWHMAFDNYIHAYKLRPHRAEPLIKIAEHYWPDAPNKTDANIPLCYLFARPTLDLPYPEQEKLWVDKFIYDYARYDMLSKSAGHVGQNEIGEEATLKAIKAHVPHLHNNLMCYLEAKKNK